MAGMFEGIGDPKVKASRDSNYFKRGHYLVRIDKVKADQTRQGRQFLAIETTIIHTFKDGDGQDLQGNLEQGDQQWHTPGDTPSQLLMADQDTFLPNVKAFVAQVTGTPEGQITSEVCNEMTAEDNPLGGLVAEVQNRLITTKAGNPFTRINWVREWAPSEFVQVADQKMLDELFPNLDALLKLEEEDE